MKKRIIILGSTGSIGENALNVVRHLDGEIEVVGIAARSRTARLAEQAREFSCSWAFTALPEQRDPLASSLPTACRSLRDEQELLDAVTAPDVDMLLCAIVGTAGLAPVLAAIRAGKDIALASKEILVMAGEIVMGEARRRGVRILPVDSEHCAIFQCLEENHPPARIIITASGGPFRNQPDLDLDTVTPEMAGNHPTWKMGGKITIDSSTLMNKGLEVIEARWLFNLQPEQIETVVHPQSIIHSMVEFKDGSILAQMGYPDMQLPIQYCLTWPERLDSPVRRMDFEAFQEMTFEPPDHARFPAIQLAKSALAAGGVAPCVFNAANEIAVEHFVEGNLRYPGIWQTVEAVLAMTDPGHPTSLEEILEADTIARKRAQQFILKH